MKLGSLRQSPVAGIAEALEAAQRPVLCTTRYTYIHVIHNLSVYYAERGYVIRLVCLSVNKIFSTHYASKGNPVLDYERWDRQSVGELDINPGYPVIGCHYFPPGREHFPAEEHHWPLALG